MTHRTTVISVGIGPSFPDSIASLPLDVSGGEVSLLPSSLQRRDHPSTVLRHHLRDHGVRSHLLLPASLPGTILGRTPYSGPGEGASERPLRLPQGLVTANSLWAVVDLDTVTGRGPYVLDLLARYTNLASRFRLLGSRDRAHHAASLLRWRPFDLHLITHEFAGYTFSAWTTDPIAAELVSLALVDEDLTRDHELTGPWEDAFVQAATEHDLGARLPADLELSGQQAFSGPALDLLHRVAERIGVTIT